MRVAFFTHYAAMYGANRSLLNLIQGLGSHGVKPFVIGAHHGEVIDALLQRSVPTRVIRFEPWSGYHLTRGGRFRRLSDNLRALPQVLKQLREWDVDIVYTNSSIIPIGAAAARILRCPHVWHLREFGKLDYGLCPDWSNWVHERVIAKAHAQIAVSECIRAHYLHRGLRANAHVIYNGVATRSEFDRRYLKSNREIRPKGPYTFAIVGIVRPEKGQDTAIRAMAALRGRFPNTRLLVVGGAGDAAYFEHCKSLARQLGLARNVEFWGYVSDPYKAFHAADAVLVCSLNEAMGRVTVEAMSACRPVIGHDYAGTTELIDHETTGLLYSGGVAELAAAMTRFIQNPVWARQLGKNGWAHAREAFTVERYAAQVFAVLNSICPDTARSEENAVSTELPKEQWLPI